MNTKKRAEFPKTEPRHCPPLPSLEQAIEVWRSARRKFLRRTGRAALDELDFATSLLYATLLDSDGDKPWARTAFSEFRKALITAEAQKPRPVEHPLPIFCRE